VVLLAVGVFILKLVLDRWGPGRLRGVASRGEAERLLGVTRLRKVRSVVRPDLENDKLIWPHCAGLIWPHPGVG
jgi:hypothetical protein